MLLVTDEHFQKAAELAINPTQIPTQQGQKPCDQSDAAGSTQGARREHARSEFAKEKTAKKAVFASYC